MGKNVYFFSKEQTDGNAGMKELLGGKGDSIVFRRMRTHFSAAGAYSYLLFVLIYFPCISALGVAIQYRKPGIRVPVFPEAVAEGKIELPPYMKK